MDEAVTVTSELGTDFSIWGLILQADIVVQFVMLVLAGMSVWSWTIMFDKSMTLGAIKSKAKKFEDQFWSGRPLDELGRKVKDKPDHPMARIFMTLMDEFTQDRGHGDPAAASRLESVARVHVNRELEKIQSQLSVLATIGSAAPFIGLFGTVWGIMNAFRGIGATGDANLAVVAPGIAEALFATALGLVAAIPAVIGYNRYAAGVNSYAVRLEGFATEFVAILSRRLGEGA
ncbi:TolQ protein, inner membrane protein, tolerance to group A colicins [Parvularcula bermudensis HTCC2503]|uniref:Tol-Pal system protein TolQ n=1 Tax=Parvularcula bermudensis (strain ATCC BAA-594 / HTCC2503 / KCTC 12087) TaxID=314260 RepID=E0TDJ1_PARBH|nr:protein TolQ [Parvularcula bermudensis]ADM08746.1 TolQ protein, inner membrane protein, tolerance to group A colicins [Parvularcula bermudensis HTCC2503]